MIVAWDEEFASVKLYHDIKDVGVKPYEVIPIEDLLDAWEKQRAEQTEPNSSEKPNNCDECPHAKCLYKADRKDEPQTDCAWK